MVIQRELRAHSRRAGSYWGRTAAGALAALALLQSSYSWTNGRDLFFTGVTLAFVACLLDGIRRGAVTINEEENEGTFGLLVLTPLTGPQILRGKFAAAVLASFQTGLAAAPVLAASLLLGGVSAGEFVRSAIALAHTLSIALVVSIIVSAQVKETIRATLRAGFLLVTGILIFTTCAATEAMPTRLISPMTPIFTISDSTYHFWKPAFWISILLSQSLALWLFHRCGKRLITNWWSEQERQTLRAEHPFAPVIMAEADALPLFAKRRAPRWFEMHPFQWLTLRDIKMHSGRRWLITVVIAFSVFMILIGPPGLFFGFAGFAIFAGWYCICAARIIARSRRSGALELLLTTPFGESGIIEGHIAAQRHTFFWPFVTASVAFFLLFRWAFHPVPTSYWLLTAYFIFGFFCIFFATPWIGIWVALHTNTVERAIFWTIILVLAVPRLFFCFYGDATYLPILGLMMRSLLLRNFRRLVGERFTPA